MKLFIGKVIDVHCIVETVGPEGNSKHKRTGHVKHDIL